MIKPFLRTYWLLVLGLISASAVTPSLFLSTYGVPADFNFASAGDWGCKSNTRNTVNNIVSKNTELTLGLGDYSYRSTADCWFDIISPLDSQMKISVGNHDDESSSKLQQYINHFGLTEQYYSFNYQNVHFLAMSTELPLGPGSAQYAFVNNDLASAASDPNIGWIVVYYHRLAYSSPSSHSPYVTLRDSYHSLFEQYGVDLVLQAHNHNYERSYPIRYNATDPSKPIIADVNINNYNDPDGQIFATVGTGGQSLYSFSGKDPYIAAQYVGYGFLNVDILNEGLTLRATYYANSGTVKDQFTISKGGTSPGGYSYDPSLELTGTNYYDVPSSSSLQLTEFSVAAWFKTTNDYGGNAYIVTKGGFGSETAGNNNNYGIWMTGFETIRAGFETTSGTDYLVTSTARYNDGNWHYAVVTYDGFSTLALYIDGVLVAARSTSGAIPDNTGTQPLRVGANSLSLNGFFTGSADEVRVWSRVLNASEIASQYNEAMFDTSGQVLHLPF